jgi:hypothetical protein
MEVVKLFLVNIDLFQNHLSIHNVEVFKNLISKTQKLWILKFHQSLSTSTLLSLPLHNRHAFARG